MTTLGVNVAGATAWLALVRDDGTVDAEPGRFALPNLPRPEALVAALDSLDNLYRREDVSVVAMLDAQSNAKPNSYQSARPRIGLEVLIEVAAARNGIRFDLLSPAAVQSRLSLPSRKVADHVDDVVDPAGTRWRERGPAALAAVAATGAR